ncbi:hypothetical protein C8Q77DRAFT_264840 [Trametes polyzona]|nr:hypothetical protein C8Q77DRAFT_264840 [Trametes polyzona]
MSAHAWRSIAGHPFHIQLTTGDASFLGQTTKLETLSAAAPETHSLFPTLRGNAHSQGLPSSRLGPGWL